MLQLSGHGARPVEDEFAAAQQVAVVAGMRLVEEELPEEATLQQPRLPVAVLPVVRLRRADRGQVDAAQRVVQAPGDDEFSVVREAPVSPDVAEVALVERVAHALARVAGILLAGIDLPRIHIFPVVAPQILARELQPETLGQRMRAPRQELDDRALAPRQGDRRSRLVDRRGRDDVHDPFGRVGAVQRRPGAPREFDALDVHVGRRDHVDGVDPERRDARIAVVDDAQQASGGHIVEAAHDRVALGKSRGRHVHSGKRLYMVRGSPRDDAGNLIAGQGGDGGRGIEFLFLAA